VPDVIQSNSKAVNTLQLLQACSDGGRTYTTFRLAVSGVPVAACLLTLTLIRCAGGFSTVTSYSVKVLPIAVAFTSECFNICAIILLEGATSGHRSQDDCSYLQARVHWSFVPQCLALLKGAAGGNQCQGRPDSSNASCRPTIHPFAGHHSLAFNL
jgi:hypothetical protein